MVDPDQHEGAGRAEAGVLLDRLGERRDQMGAVELAGQGIVPRQPHELLVAGVALVVDSHDALRAPRPSVGAGKPDAGLLDPDHRHGGGGAHAVFDAVGHALVRPRRRRMDQRVIADGAGRLDQLGKFGAGGKRFHGDVGKDRGRVLAPDQAVAADLPDETGLAERGEDVGGLRDRRHQVASFRDNTRVILHPKDRATRDLDPR